MFQRGEAKLLVEDWEGAVADLKSAAEKSPQVLHQNYIFISKDVSTLIIEHHCKFTQKTDLKLGISW